MAWLVYVAAWLAASIFYTLAAAAGVGRSPIEALPFGLFAMGSAGLMGVAVWRLTDRVPWNPRAASFYTAHVLAILTFMLLYAMSVEAPDVMRGRVASVFQALRVSPITKW